MVKRWIGIACLLPLGAAAVDTGSLAAPEPGTAERIARVERGLVVKPIRIAGEPVETRTLRDTMTEHKIPGISVAVVDEGRVAWAKGYGVADLRSGAAVTTDTLFSAGSISKAITAVVVLRLVDAGTLDLDCDINPALSGWKLTRAAGDRGAAEPAGTVTLRQLLSHSSGVDGHFHGAYVPGEPVPTLIQLLNGQPPATIAKVDRRHPAGAFLYSGAAFTVIEKYLTDVIGEPFPAIVQRVLFDPAGMRHSTFVQPAKDRPDPTRAAAHFGTEAKLVAFHELASSGLWTTPTDLARFLIALQKSGQPGGLLSTARYDELLTPVVNNAGLGIFLAGANDSLRLRVRGTDGRGADGYSAFLTGYAGQGKGAIVMTNTGGLRLGFTLLRGIATEYAWPDYVPVRKVYPSDPAQFSRYLGKYEVDGGAITFTAEGEAMFLNLSSRRLPLLRSGPQNYFTNADMFNEVEFRFLAEPGVPAGAVVLQYPTHTYVGTRAVQAAGQSDGASGPHKH